MSVLIALTMGQQRYYSVESPHLTVCEFVATRTPELVPESLCWLPVRVKSPLWTHQLLAHKVTTPPLSSRLLENSCQNGHMKRSTELFICSLSMNSRAFSSYLGSAIVTCVNSFTLTCRTLGRNHIVSILC